MKLFVSFCLLAAVATAAFAADDRVQFADFVRKYKKTYATQEEREHRFGVFKANLKKIEAHNKAGRSWTERINQFADLTQDEFKARLGYINTMKPSYGGVVGRGHPAYAERASQRPDSKDWRDDGVISDVKDQGACGSCWSFAAVEMIESYAALNNGTLLELSAQQLTSCTPNSMSCGGTGGCAGGIPQQSFGYNQLFGLVPESEWPYTSGNFGDTGSCDYDPDAMTEMTLTRGFEVLERNNYETVMDHIANIGPLAVAVDASVWSFYGGGVAEFCADYDANIGINHAVQLVGYGTDADSGLDYWLIRNSWDTTWGESGYMKLKRETTTKCGYDRTPLTGTACINDGNDEQYVCGTCAILFDISYPIGTHIIPGAI